MDSRRVSGAYPPRRDEIVERNLTVIGDLPRQLAGRVVRVNPSPPRRMGPDHEWFAGAGMIHAVRLEEGRALEYRNRWVRTPEVSRALGETPHCDPLPYFDAANTHVMPFRGELSAMTETCPPYRLDLDPATLRREDFGAIERFTSHPRVDPVTGELHAVGYAMDDAPVATHWIIDCDGKAMARRDVLLAASAFVRDFVLTRRHVVFYDLPLRFHAGDNAAGKAIPYRWEASGSARIGVLSRDHLDDAIRWIDIEACSVFHTLNVDDDVGDAIVLGLVRFDRFYDQNRTGPDDTQLFDGEARSGVLLHDFAGGQSVEWLAEPGERISEVVFVRCSDGAREGEGWLLGLRTGSESKGAELLVFEAEALGEGPVARVEIPHRIPVDVHGSWVPASTADGGCAR